MIECDRFQIVEAAAAGHAALYLVPLNEKRSDVLGWLAREATARHYRVDSTGLTDGYRIGAHGGWIEVRDVSNRRGRRGFTHVCRGAARGGEL